MIPPASHPEGSVQRIGPGDIRDLPSGLQKLIGAPKRLSAQRLWRALNADEKSATLKEHIHPKENRAELVQLVAEARNFRRKTVNGWDDDKIVQAAQPLSFSNPLAASLLSLMHLKRRREMLARFLDALGIPNEDGIVPPDEEGVATRRHEVGEAEAHAAAVDLAREHGLRRVVVYFLTLAILGEPFADHLWSWLKGLSASTDEVAEADPEATPLDDAETYIAGSEGDPSRQRSFTTLDRLLIEAIVDSKQGVVGSLDEDEVNDAVDEFASLNGRRQHSYFHLGFRDVLFDGGPRPKLPATNRKRARWYWAGAILGWARSESWDRIVAAFDENPEVQRLGDGSDFATEEAARHVVRALSESDRAAEVAKFVRTRALYESPTFLVLFSEMLDIGTELLWRGDESEARSIFDRLMEAVRELEEHGYPPAFAPFLTVRRRQAHCLQRALEHARARRCLENLLELESDPNHQAMVHADLGLLASRFNSLDEVSLPFGRHELPDLVDRLREGVEHFQRSVAKDVEYAAHGHYCLGVLALAEHTLAPSKDKYGVAEDHFLRARSRFGARRKSYGKVLVEQTNLYFGISKAAQAESAGELAHAARIMMSALEGGAAFPPYLIDPVVAGLEVGSATDELASFATALLATGDDDALDALAKSTAVVQECGEVSDALRQRAHRLGKSELAAADLRSCLVGYLRAGRYREAEEVLDQLEALAVQGVGVAEFEELLATKAGYQPAWEPEEATIARARCLEARNQLEDALVLLQPLVHQYATEGDLHDAGGVLDRLRGYGLPTEYLALEENRVNALAEQDRTHLDAVASSAPKRQGKPVRVLFVGGDERQAKSENAVRQQVRDRAPHVQLKFIYPGWSGNWSHHLERVNAELKRHDALVMMRFMRTELGKQIRKRCDKPWRFCWGAGRKQMSDAIIAAAQAGATPD